jgi:hypothetical protein
MSWSALRDESRLALDLSSSGNSYFEKSAQASTAFFKNTSEQMKSYFGGPFPWSANCEGQNRRRKIAKNRRCPASPSSLNGSARAGPAQAKAATIGSTYFIRLAVI